jgi:hypothetical protein
MSKTRGNPRPKDSFLCQGLIDPNPTRNRTFILAEPNGKRPGEPDHSVRRCQGEVFGSARGRQ